MSPRALTPLLIAALWGCCPAPGDAPRPPAEDPVEDPSGAPDPDRLSPRGNQQVSSFDRAKDLIPEVFAGAETTFYCGCDYTDKKVDLKSCGYTPRKNRSRASRVEIEHVVPAASFGQDFRAWSHGHPDCLDSKGEPYKGRRCAEKVAAAFRHIEADLYNLQPAIGEVNGDRSDKDIARIPGEAREYGECDVEIDERGVEPREAIRGDVARTYRYMDWAYPGLGIIHDGNRDLIDAWDKADPVTDQERRRARRIARLQGNSNPFLE